MILFNPLTSKKTILSKNIKIKTSKHSMQTEVDTTIRTSNAVVDYNIKKESNYIEESEEIMKYIYNGIKESTKFSEIASDSVSTLGYIIDARSFAYTVEYLREQLSKQGSEETAVFNTLINTIDDLGLYNISGDNAVLNDDYKNIYTNFVDSIQFNTLDTKDISEKDSSNTASNTASDMVSDTKQQDIEILDYITRSINTETPISYIIKESFNLGYHMSSTDFFNAMETLIKNDPELMLNYLRKYDDKDLYFIASDDEICKYSTSNKEYYQILEETSSDSESSNNSTLKQNDDSFSTESSGKAHLSEDYYTIPVASDSDTSSHSSRSSSDTSLESDVEFNHNLTIALLTFTAFLAIRGLVALNTWYQHKYNSNVVPTDDNSENQLNSVQEDMLNLTNITTKMLLCLIPIFIVILYKLRYYYYSRLLYFFKSFK